MPTHPLRLIGSLLIVLLLAACGGAAAPEPTAAPAPTAEPAPAPTALPAAEPTAAPATGNASGTAPADASVPVFPGAVLPDETDPVGIALRAAQEQFAQEEQGTVSGYVLPADNTFEEVAEFYRTEMPALGWEPVEIPDAEVDPEQGGVLFFLSEERQTAAGIFVSLGAIPIEGGGNLLLIVEDIPADELPN